MSPREFELREERRAKRALFLFRKLMHRRIHCVSKHLEELRAEIEALPKWRRLKRWKLSGLVKYNERAQSQLQMALAEAHNFREVIGNVNRYGLIEALEDFLTRLSAASLDGEWHLFSELERGYIRAAINNLKGDLQAG